MKRALLLAAMAVVFVLLSQAVAAGLLEPSDRQVAADLQHAWIPLLSLPGEAVALLGGLEVTFGLAAVLFAFLWQAGFRIQSFAAGAYGLGAGLEALYKWLVFHPAPSHRLAHPDGPSVTSFLPHGGVSNSFPSGHVVRAVIVYGLAAFVVYRLAESEGRARLAVGAAALVVLLVAFDRVYLQVHWLSDVVGGLLLGGVCLLAAMFWMDLSPRLLRRRRS